MESSGSLDKPIELKVNDLSDAGPSCIPVHQRTNSNDDLGSVGDPIEAWLNDSAHVSLPVYPAEDDKELGEAKVTYSIKTLRCGKVIQAPIGKDQNTSQKVREINEILSMNRTTSGPKNIKDTGSKCKTKSLAALSDESANSKSQSSKNVEEFESFDADKAQEDESQILSGVGRGKLWTKTKISLNRNFVDEGLKQTSSVDPDDDIEVKMTLKECLLQIKAKKKANMAPDVEEIQFPREEETLGSFKQKLTKRVRSQRENLEPMQTSGHNGIEESSVSFLEHMDAKSCQCNVESRCGLGAIETNSIPAGSESSDLMASSEQNYCGKPVLEKEIWHKWVALGAKFNLSSGSKGGIQEQQSDGSQPKKRQKKEVKHISESSIQLPEEARNVKETEHGQSKESGLCSEASDIRSSVADADADCNARMDLLPVETLDMEGDCRGGNFQQQPAKLPLARKVICPMTQESLLHATDSEDGCNTSPKTTGGKCRDLFEQNFVSEKQGLQDTISMLEDMYLKRSLVPEIKAPVSPCYNKTPPFGWRKKSPVPKGVRSSPKPQSPLPLGGIIETNSIENQREEASPSPSLKGILKSPCLRCPTACGCAECASTRARAEKASEFSQRQMRDIESLAARLIRELKVMRTIVEENVIPKADQSTVSPSKFTIEEIKAAAASASELEERAKKWITMMTRDCNRYCKIMKHREGPRRRKIIFADEVGGELYCVRFFDVHTHCDSSVATNEEERDFEENFSARKAKKIDF